VGRKGLVDTVINREAILLVQSRIEDAGFKDIDIIPLGEDKVFIHSLSKTGVMKIVGDAKEFFLSFLLKPCEMGKEGGAFSKGCMVEIVWYTFTCIE